MTTTTSATELPAWVDVTKLVPDGYNEAVRAAMTATLGLTDQIVATAVEIARLAAMAGDLDELPAEIWPHVSIELGWDQLHDLVDVLASLLVFSLWTGNPPTRTESLESRMSSIHTFRGHRRELPNQPRTRSAAPNQQRLGRCPLLSLPTSQATPNTNNTVISSESSAIGTHRAPMAHIDCGLPITATLHNETISTHAGTGGVGMPCRSAQQRPQHLGRVGLSRARHHRGDLVVIHPHNLTENHSQHARAARRGRLRSARGSVAECRFRHRAATTPATSQQGPPHLTPNSLGDNERTKVPGSQPTSANRSAALAASARLMKS